MAGIRVPNGSFDRAFKKIVIAKPPAPKKS